jgi:tetratricopeptide (TPR) repeat protein
MDPRKIRRLQEGMSEARNRQIFDVCVGRGLVRGSAPESPEEIARLISETLTPEDLRRINEEIDSATIPTRRLPPVMPADAAEAAQDPSRCVSHYIRVKLLGSGGMGEVWKAWDRSLQRWVALKLLKSDRAEERARFAREAKMAGGLSHPHIAQVYEAKEEYIAMQYVDGPSLAGRRPEAAEAVEIVRQAAHAIHYAHERGVLHRDLKPGNIVLAAGDRPHGYVLDFGLARPMDAASTLSTSGMILGTPSYMPPEQATGDLRRIDRRSDVYSLGATLYEALTGRPPFTGVNPYQILKRIETKEPVAPRKLDPRIDGDLETIVLKCLEKEPERRYATARELAEDLERYQRHESILAAPPGPADRLRRLFRRHPGTAAALAGAALLAVLAAWMAVRWSRESRLAEALERVSASYSSLVLRIRTGALTAEAQGLPLRELEAECNRIVASAPRDPRPRRARASARLLLGDLEGAEEDARAALELDPGHGRTVLLRATLYLRRSQRESPAETAAVNFGASGARIRFLPASSASVWLDRARADLAQAMRLGVSGSEAKMAEAMILFIEGKFDRSLDHLGEALRGDLYWPEGFYFRGVCAQRLGRIDEAIENLTRAAEQGARLPAVYVRRAMAHAQRGRWAEAIEDCSAALRLDPGAVEPLFNRASYLAAAERWDEVEADLARLPRTADALSLRAYLYRRRGRLDEALDALKQAVELDPRCALARAGLGNTLLEMGRPAEALREFDEALELWPEQPETLSNRAIARARTGDSIGARRDYDASLRLETGAAATWLNRGILRYGQKDYRGSMEDAAAAIERDPVLAEAWALRGDSRLKVIDSESRTAVEELRYGIKDLERAIQLKPALQAQVGQLLKLAQEQLSSFEE